MRLKGTNSFIRKAIVIGSSVALLVIVAAFFIVYAQSDESAYKAAIRNGNMYLEKGDYLMAMNYFDEAARYNAKLVSEYLAVYRGFRDENNILRAREAIEKAYYNALNNSPERLDEVKREFASFLVDVYESEYKPKGDYRGALDWFGDWPKILDDNVLTEKYNEVLLFLANEEEEPTTENVIATPEPVIEIETAEPVPSVIEDEEEPTKGTSPGSTTTRPTPTPSPVLKSSSRPTSTPRPTFTTRPTPTATSTIRPTPTPTIFSTPRPPSSPTPTPTPKRSSTPKPSLPPKTPPIKDPPRPTPTPTPTRTPRPVVEGTYHYSIKNETDQNLTLPCFKDVKFQMAVYDVNGYVTSYSVDAKGSIPVMAYGETIVSFVNANIDSTKRESEVWDWVTYEESEPALVSYELAEGTTYTFTNQTDKSQTAKFPSYTKNYHVTYKSNMEIASFSARGRASVSVPARGSAVVTITEGGGTAYFPARMDRCLDFSGGGVGLEVKKLFAGSTHTVYNGSDEDIRVAIVGNFDVYIYTAKYFDSDGKLKSEAMLRGKDIKVLSGGKTEVTIGSVNLSFCYPSEWAVIFEEN